jgi:hypothetical protein
MIATCIASLVRFQWPEHATARGVSNDAGAMFAGPGPDTLVQDRRNPAMIAPWFAAEGSIRDE